MLSVKKLLLKLLSYVSSDTGWKTLPEGTASGYTKFNPAKAQYCAKAGVCYISIYNNTGTITTGWKNIGALPADASPSTQLYGSMCNRNGVMIETQIYTNGNVFINVSASTTFLSGMFAFPCSYGT